LGWKNIRVGKTYANFNVMFPEKPGYYKGTKRNKKGGGTITHGKREEKHSHEPQKKKAQKGGEIGSVLGGRGSGGKTKLLYQGAGNIRRGRVHQITVFLIFKES